MNTNGSINETWIQRNEETAKEKQTSKFCFNVLSNDKIKSICEMCTQRKDCFNTRVSEIVNVIIQTSWKKWKNTINWNPNECVQKASHPLLCLPHMNINGKRVVAVGASDAVNAAIAAVAAAADSVNYIVESIRFSLYLSNFVSNKPYMQSTPLLRFHCI